VPGVAPSGAEPSSVGRKANAANPIISTTCYGVLPARAPFFISNMPRKCDS